MELLDIIDYNEEIIGPKERAIAHQQHLLHRAIHIIIQTSDDKILLQLRTANRQQYPSFWCGSVAGHVDSGEVPQQAAYREMQEELGINVPISFVGKCTINDSIEHELVYIYFGKSDGPFRYDKTEMERIELIPKRQLLKTTETMKLTPHCRTALKMVLNYLLL